MNKNSLEKLLWSIAFPGFGQLLNHKYLKGLMFIGLEFLVNYYSDFNVAIVSSFNGHIDQSFEQLNLNWIMFYPCLYFFSMWDAVKDANGGDKDTPLLFLPFVFAAYFVTLGLIFSKVSIFGVKFGPIFLPMISVIPGVFIGLLLRKILISRLK